MNKEDSFKPIVDYIEAQYESYLQEELKIKRNLSRFDKAVIFVQSDFPLLSVLKTYSFC